LRGAAAAATIFLLAGAAGVVAGCGKSGQQSPPELALEREHLIFVTQALRNLQPQAAAEVAAAKAAWPQIANGLPSRSTGLLSPQIRAAIVAGARLQLPPLLQERQVAALTGPATNMAGLYRAFSGLASRNWQMIGAMMEQVERGPPAAARFARENIPLYIDGIYDAHFGLAQIGKQLGPAYEKLGGPEAFAGSLTQAEVDAVVDAYSEASDLLVPHVGVRVGS
jgi:hypothetical protein